DQILAAAEEFSGASSVKVSRLKQFSAVPTALVLIQFVLQEGVQIPPGLISAWLYDALRHFRRPEQPHPAVTLEYSEGNRRSEGDGKHRRRRGRLNCRESDCGVRVCCQPAWKVRVHARWQLAGHSQP